MRFAFIRAHATQYRITTMCRVLRVSKAGYYAWEKRDPTAREQETQALLTQITVVHRASQRRYGSPRVHRELRALGRFVSRKRVAQVMRQHGLRAKGVRRWRVTTVADPAAAPAPNRLARQFAPDTYTAPNRAWVGDITYLWTREGWLYLAVLLDLATREVVGWAMRHSLDGALALDALHMALQRRRPAPGLLVHHDRGTQYTAAVYQQCLAQHGAVPSMSRKGNCWDNAVAESFFATLKRELLPDTPWATREEARAALFDYLERWYNRCRRHSTLKYRTPHEYAQHLGRT
jgi:transposase InsO family protein